jgi:hypothetical protein
MGRLHGNRGGIVRILLIIFGVFFLCLVITGIYIAMHWKGWAADVANAAAQQIVRESGLPDEQREDILTEIRQLGDDFKTGKISTEELGRVAKAIAESPLIPLAGIQAAREKYIEPSNMTQAQKAAGILSLQRFARGVHERKISKEIVDDVIKPITELQPNGRWRLKEHPTQLEIEQLIENAKARADEAMIPDEPFDLNIADELRKAIHGV